MPENTDETALSMDAHAATQAGEVSTGRAPVIGSRYELLTLLGAGGMGNVYKAHDRELDEIVALKVLRPEIAGAPGALDRFRRELKLARRVTHPNVARVFDIGEHGGNRILTMELVVGESLAALLERERVLPTVRAIEIAACIGAGVAAAHGAGVIHRDLKPDNVLLGTDGRIVVTDFGIARAFERDDTGLTAAGFVGTPAYIAPEQVESPQTVDHRADIYALGEIIYEMIAGHRPWHGETILAIVAHRLSSPPPDACDKRPDANAELAALARHCMARNPSERVGTMDDVITALRAITPEREPVKPQHRPTTRVLPPEPRTSHKHVAVLPFRNAGPETDGYLADGLTEDLIDLLTAADGLRVTSRGVVMRHRGADHDPRDVGRELGVQVVVEGTVRRAPGSIRINARLVSVDDGFQLWAQRFDGTEADVLTLNERVARAVATALTVDIHGEARGAVADPGALDLYLRARSAFLGFYVQGFESSLDLFAQALARSPNDPRVIAGYVMAHASSVHDAARATELRRLADRALALAPSLPDAHVALGALLFHQSDAVGAVGPFVRALRLAPNHAEAHDLVGRLLLEADALEGVPHVEAALALEPAMGLPRGALARHVILRGDWERGEAIIDGAARPDAAIAMRCRYVLWHRDVERILALLAHFPPEGTGVKADTRKLLELAAYGTAPDMTSFVVLSRGGTRTRSFFAQVDAEMGAHLRDPERVIRALERADADGLWDIAWLDRAPVLASIRDRADFARVRDRIAARAAAARAAYVAASAPSG